MSKSARTHPIGGNLSPYASLVGGVPRMSIPDYRILNKGGFAFASDSGVAPATVISS